MMRRTWRLLPLLGVMALGGCGKELTAGGLHEGEVSAVATDQDAGASGARYALVPDAGARTAGLAAVEGVVGVRVAVSLVGESGALVPITDGAVVAQVGIGSSARVPLGDDSVPEGIYPAVRLTFTEVLAQVQGLPLAGSLFTGAVAVDLGGGVVEVDVPVTVTVRAQARSTVVLRLNSAAWLSLAQLVPSVPPSARVTAAAFRQAIALTVE